MRIAVTGGRRFGLKREERLIICATLDGYWSPDLKLAQGGAEGVDHVCAEWYIERRSRQRLDPVVPVGFLADWNRLGNGAGHERNGRMLREFKPDILVAFPGDTGTNDCKVQAYRMNITIHEYDKTGLGKVISRIDEASVFNGAFDLDMDDVPEIPQVPFDLPLGIAARSAKKGDGVSIEILNSNTSGLRPVSYIVYTAGEDINIGDVVMTLNDTVVPYIHKN